MKKLFVILLVLAMIQGVCAAEIKTTTDKFDGNVTVRSRILRPSKSFSEVSLVKMFINKTPPTVGYAMTFNRFSQVWLLFDKQPVEIKFDDNPTIYKLNIGAISHEPSAAHGLLDSFVTVAVPYPIPFRMLLAKKITIRVWMQNAPPIIWEVGENILQEWRHMICTFPDGSVPKKLEIIHPDTGNPYIIEIINKDKK